MKIFTCSNCLTATTSTERKPNFCPECGVKFQIELTKAQPFEMATDEEAELISQKYDRLDSDYWEEEFKKLLRGEI